MTITFEAPSDNGGAAITSYAITSDPAGATCTVGANATTYTCTGLTAGTNYTYTVKAINSKGESSASLASSPVTAVAVPSAPQNVSAVITAGTTTLSATVSFDAPATDNGSAVISYTVTASPGGATCTVSAPTTYCDIPVLPDSLYTFTATATNAVGTSVASTTSLQTAARNGIEPSLKVDPIPAPTGELVENTVLTSSTTSTSYESTPNSVVTYIWKRCTDPLDDTTCTTISGATSSTYTLTSADVDKYIRVETTATNSIGTITNLSTATEVITAAPVITPTTPTTPTTPDTPIADSAPAEPTCNAACQASQAAVAKAAADKAAADAEGGGDKDGATRVLRDVHHGGFGLVYRFELLACAFVEDAAILGGLQRAGGAVKKADAQMLFKVRDPGRGHGGRGALIAGGRTHAAQFIDTDEHFDVVHVGHLGTR